MKRDGRFLRRVFAAVAWLFVGCIVIQFFLVGLRVMNVEPWTELHRAWAYTYGWLAPVLVLLGVATDAAPRTRRLSLALLILFAVQTFLPLLKTVAPWIAALHAVNAFVVAWAAISLALAATEESRRAGDRVPVTPGWRDADDPDSRLHEGGIDP